MRYKPSATIAIALAILSLLFTGCEPVDSVSAESSDNKKIELQNLQAELEEARAKYEQQTTELAEVTNSLAQTKANNAGLSRQLENARTAFVELNGDMTKANSKLEQLAIILTGERNDTPVSPSASAPSVDVEDEDAKNHVTPVENPESKDPGPAHQRVRHP